MTFVEVNTPFFHFICFLPVWLLCEIQTKYLNAKYWSRIRQDCLKLHKASLAFTTQLLPLNFYSVSKILFHREDLYVRLNLNFRFWISKREKRTDISLNSGTPNLNKQVRTHRQIQFYGCRKILCVTYLGVYFFTVAWNVSESTWLCSIHTSCLLFFRPSTETRTTTKTRANIPPRTRYRT